MVIIIEFIMISIQVFDFFHYFPPQTRPTTLDEKPSLKIVFFYDFFNVFFIYLDNSKRNYYSIQSNIYHFLVFARQKMCDAASIVNCFFISLQNHQDFYLPQDQLNPIEC